MGEPDHSEFDTRPIFHIRAYGTATRNGFQHRLGASSNHRTTTASVSGIRLEFIIGTTTVSSGIRLEPHRILGPQRLQFRAYSSNSLLKQLRYLRAFGSNLIKSSDHNVFSFGHTARIRYWDNYGFFGPSARFHYWDNHDIFEHTPLRDHCDIRLRTFHDIPNYKLGSVHLH